MSRGASPAAPLNERAQVAPAVTAMEFALVTVESFGAERLVEAIRRVRRLAEQQHRGHAAVHEPLGYRAQQSSSEPLTLHPLQQVNLVEFPFISGYASIVRSSLREANQLVIVVFDDITKPATVLPVEGFAPLMFPQFV